jgi:hypothetical protein
MSAALSVDERMAFHSGGFSFPVTCLMPYYVQNWSFSSPNHVTLRITLMYCVHW